ncbi:hypothetical protein HK096_007807, partial [Nowakowskiella sp. JEL0078]
MGNKLSTFKTNRKNSKANILRDSNHEVLENTRDVPIVENPYVSFPISARIQIRRKSSLSNNVENSSETMSLAPSVGRSKRIGSIGSNATNYASTSKSKTSTMLVNLDGNDVSAFGVQLVNVSSESVVSSGLKQSKEFAIEVNPYISAGWQPGRPFSMGDELLLAHARRKFYEADKTIYVLPTDEKELERIELEHFSYTLAFGGLFNLPIHETLKEQGLMVLDVGCGPGVWSRDVAKKYPQANIYAIAIPDEYFDAVFQRLLRGAIPEIKWNDEIKELSRVLKPGGFIEFVEFSEYRQLGPKGTLLLGSMRKALEHRGLDINIANNLNSRMEKAGLLIESEKKISCPVGWEGELGEVNLQNIRMFTESAKPFMMKSLTLSSDNYNKLVEDAILEFPKYKTCLDIVSVVGKKIVKILNFEILTLLLVEIGRINPKVPAPTGLFAEKNSSTSRPSANRGQLSRARPAREPNSISVDSVSVSEDAFLPSNLNTLNFESSSELEVASAGKEINVKITDVARPNAEARLDTYNNSSDDLSSKSHVEALIVKSNKIDVDDGYVVSEISKFNLNNGKRSETSVNLRAESIIIHDVVKVNAEIAANWKPESFKTSQEVASLEVKRRFHAIENSLYPLPADIEEQDRLELLHLIMSHIFGSLFHMPIHENLKKEGGRILDVGCGPDPDNYFDAVFQRFLVAGIPKHKWDDVITELKRVTKPGGYIEMVEIDDFKRLGPNGTIVLGGVFQALELRGLDTKIALNTSERMKKAGLKIESEILRSIPIGWNGKVGEMQLRQISMNLKSLKPFMMNSLEVTSETYDKLVEESLWEYPIQKSYCDGISVVGKKVINLRSPGIMSVIPPIIRNESYESKTSKSASASDSRSNGSSGSMKLNEDIAANWKPEARHYLRDDILLDSKRRFHSVENSPYPLPADIGERDR